MKCKVYYKDNVFEGESYQAPHFKNHSKIIHREDGPAIEWDNGTKHWFLNDKLHREDGPAIEYSSGIKEWYLNGKYLKTLSQAYLVRYMELTGETLATLLLHPDEIIRSSAKRYKWSN